MSPTSLNPEATPFLPAITSLPTLPLAALAATLDLLFEYSPELHSLALPTLRNVSFSSYDDLIKELRRQLLSITDSLPSSTHDDRTTAGDTGLEEDAALTEVLHRILASHPRLGEPKKETLSQQSRNEQKHLTAESPEVVARLREMNAVYEDRFPGLRYVVFVNGRPRAQILADMERRVQRGDVRAEEREGIEVSCFFLAILFTMLPKQPTFLFQRRRKLNPVCA